MQAIYKNIDINDYITIHGVHSVSDECDCVVIRALSGCYLSLYAHNLLIVRATILYIPKSSIDKTVEVMADEKQSDL